MITPIRPVFLLIAVFLTTSMSFAQSIPFDGSWREQGFFRLFSNSYVQNGLDLDVVSNGTVSLLWQSVPVGAQAARTARWDWAVVQGVAATDLTVKGGDDRNLALYFVYTDPETAATLTPRAARRLLRDKKTTALVYVWGGAHRRGEVLASPYHAGLRTLVRRPAGLGQFSERVDLVADYQKAFGTAPQVLVGIGVTADSDDTDGQIRARVSDLRLD